MDAAYVMTNDPYVGLPLRDDTGRMPAFARKDVAEACVERLRERGASHAEATHYTSSEIAWHLDLYGLDELGIYLVEAQTFGLGDALRWAREVGDHVTFVNVIEGDWEEM